MNWRHTASIALSAFFTLASLAALADEFTGKVVGVSDGDTITVLRTEGGGMAQVKVRLAGIDSPEGGQAYGTKAKAALSAKVFGKTVRVVYSTRDHYGRTVGDVYLGHDWINLAMVSDGFAWHYKTYSKDRNLATEEGNARTSRRGLWSDSSRPVPPWTYRSTAKLRRAVKANPKIATGSRWLNTTSNVRHNQSCKHFENTKRGRACTASEGKPCGMCGG